ncbi:Cyclic di-GMP phosphodiesterase response regulator RpfG [compost metagenome]
MVRHHHERWNGTGYPDGLRGTEIPLLARVLAVAEAFVGMTTGTPYRAAHSPSEALSAMRDSQHFDPGVLDALAAILPSLS